MAAPRGLEEAYKPVQVVLILKEPDVQLLTQVAEFRNALARMEGLKLPGRGWTRTSLAAHIISEASSVLAKEMASVVDEAGPLPTLDLEKGNDAEEKERFRREMDRYVRRVSRVRK
jgi:hypothetical protein